MMFKKAMRGRIALQKHFVRNLYVDDFILRSSPRDESVRLADFGSPHCLPAVWGVLASLSRRFGEAKWCSVM
jgi:hypothetical protein